MKKRLIFIALLGIGLIGITFVYMVNGGWRRPDTSMVLQFDLSKAKEQQRAELWQITLEQMNRRAKKLGCEYKLKDLGHEKVRIQIYGQPKSKISDVKHFFAGPRLEFRLLHPEFAHLPEPLAKSAVPPGYEVMEITTEDKNRHTYTTFSAVKITPEIDDSHIAYAKAEADQFDHYQVTIQLTNTGRQRFAEVTDANTGRFLAIVYDGQVFSAPHISSRIDTETVAINGSFDERQALELANVLNNPLILPAKVVSE